ncbi:MerR family transcriptional regulator [Listeria monocytogenes]|uniref:MerR family transcriptional regulator n=1 Tax=Listeria monocytogenes TaxID=1639 RepID=UPI0011F178E5|nr:MerR family transcriptional regulator [Listeria monocytogenes]
MTMNEKDLARVKKCNRQELREWQNKVMLEIESNYHTLSKSDREDLYNDLRTLERAGDVLKGINSALQLQLLTIEEYKEMSKSTYDVNIAKELNIHVSTLTEWKKTRGLIMRKGYGGEIKK